MADALLTLDLDRIVHALHAYAWPFLRVSGLLLVMPVLGANVVPRRVKTVPLYGGRVLVTEGLKESERGVGQGVQATTQGR